MPYELLSSSSSDEDEVALLLKKKTTLKRMTNFTENVINQYNEQEIR